MKKVTAYILKNVLIFVVFMVILNAVFTIADVGVNTTQAVATIIVVLLFTYFLARVIRRL
ncbi:hypothetical protein AM493_08980 [Flavobacterium akiainvivens]|uniref:Uncharacterized protein n=1 Tax=Flavobacterium akiainvivens TaxID=1202724 RepID=A0A0M8MH68_9FLAO|nr:hypothetical protein [Flavobacterium akiainvivens]KOS06151.1 hypothetical protein AM493_08980 [Flavobacterium akiainvivens]SFQ67961.1 hypothetical protein SAMN05444144_11430 [Flavobacterium akiainvivens]